MKVFLRFLTSLLIFFTASIYNISFIRGRWYLVLLLIFAFLFINAAPSPFYRKHLQTLRLKICYDGLELMIIFLLSFLLSSLYLFALVVYQAPDLKSILLAVFFLFIVEATVFANGIIRMYSSSVQLGLKWRLIGIFTVIIPIVNFIVLIKMIQIVSREIEFENEKCLLNKERAELKLCQTKYPILFVHGIFFRDYKYFNYWGRIPKELEINGAEIYYGNHESASSVVDSAHALAKKVRHIILETGCEKVNIIAHSKGGLDCRYAISKLGIAEQVASLTTINTPHYGCEFAEELLLKFPDKIKHSIADKYNATLKNLGDKNPDFLAAVSDLTSTACKKFNEEVKDEACVFYQSVGSKLNFAGGGQFPLNFSYALVKHFDGENDGLVSMSSFWWGEEQKVLMTDGKRGISHGDVIDLNRENIEGFDVREFYVDLLIDLKEKGF